MRKCPEGALTISHRAALFWHLVQGLLPSSLPHQLRTKNAWKNRPNQNFIQYSLVFCTSKWNKDLIFALPENEQEIIWQKPHPSTRSIPLTLSKALSAFTCLSSSISLLLTATISFQQIIISHWKESNTVSENKRVVCSTDVGSVCRK